MVTRKNAAVFVEIHSQIRKNEMLKMFNSDSVYKSDFDSVVLHEIVL